nr:hypothetical protein CFP56_70943 [Quercus suber]
MVYIYNETWSKLGGYALDGETSSDQEELRGFGAAVASVLVTCGALDSKEFGDESSGVRDSTMVTTELDGEEDDAAADGIDGRYVGLGF